MAFAPALLVVLALLWARSRRLYLDALVAGGVVPLAAQVVFMCAAVLALLALWSSRAGGGGRERRHPAALDLLDLRYLAVAVACAAAAAHLMMVEPLADRHHWIADLLHGRTRVHADPVFAVALSVLALSPLAAAAAGFARRLALPGILVPGAVVGALAAWDRPSGCEAAIAQLLLAATLGLWMLLDLVETHTTRRDAELQERGAARALDAAPRRLLSERAWFLLGVFVCCMAAVWLTWPTWKPGMIMNLDAPRHLLRSKVMAEIFLPGGHVDGWSPYWYLGAQLFLFQSYGYFLLIGATTNLLAGAVALQDVFKFFYALPIVVLPAAMAWLARGLGANRRAALAAAFASLLLSSKIGYGVGGVYGTGLLLQGVGVVLFALVWPLVLDALEGRRRAAWMAALLLGVILVTHFITGAYLLATAGVVAFVAALWRRDARPLLVYSALAIAALALSAHALFASLELRHLAGAAVGWGDPDTRLERFLTGQSVGPAWFVIPAFVAALAAIARRRGRLAIAALMLFATAVLASSSRSPWEPALVSKALGFLLRPRALPYATALTAVFVGVAFDAVLGWIVSERAGARREVGGEQVAWPWRSATAMLLTVAFVCAGLTQMATLRAMVRAEVTMRSRSHADYAQLARWLRANVARPAIVEINRRGLPSSQTGGARSIISILNLDTGLFTLGGDQAELTSAGSRTRILRGRGPVAGAEWSARRLRSYGVSHVIATDAISRQRLAASKDYQNVYESLGAAVFQVRDSGAWLSGPGVDSTPLSFAPEHMRWQVQVRGPRQRHVSAAVSWHPDWKVLVDGQAVKVTGTTQHLVSFPVPAGSHTVDLLYVRRSSEHLYNWISLVALVSVAAGLLASLRRRA